MPKISIAVLASGRGSDFQSIIDGVEKGAVNAQIAALITDNPSAGAIERAKKHNMPFFVFDVKGYPTREEYDQAIWKKLDELRVDLVVLAGYMRLIKNKEFLRAYFGRLINIHPSLLPAFPGAHAQRDAFDAKVDVSGYTIHFVDESLDGGPVILQEAVGIRECKTAEEVAAKILKREHAGLPKVVEMFARGKFKIENRRVSYSPSK